MLRRLLCNKRSSTRKSVLGNTLKASELSCLLTCHECTMMLALSLHLIINSLIECLLRFLELKVPGHLLKLLLVLRSDSTVVQLGQPVQLKYHIFNSWIIYLINFFLQSLNGISYVFLIAWIMSEEQSISLVCNVSGAIGNFSKGILLLRFWGYNLWSRSIFAYSESLWLNLIIVISLKYLHLFFGLIYIVFLLAMERGFNSLGLLSWQYLALLFFLFLKQNAWIIFEV